MNFLSINFVNDLKQLLLPWTADRTSDELKTKCWFVVKYICMILEKSCMVLQELKNRVSHVK